MMLQNKKRNNRPTGGQSSNNPNNGRSPRSRTTIAADGVYSNGYFLHAAASHLGNVVKVQTKGGVIVEGIFKTFSPNFEIALEVTHNYQNGADGKKINVETVQDFLIINPSDIVTIHAKDVDLDYVTKDTLLFQTDMDISSRVNGGSMRYEDKKLEPWDASDINGEMSVNLELDNNVNGWDVNEMFQKNEKDYGVRTTFNDTLVNYTVQIEKKDTQDFREQELQAERIANEIEKNPGYRERIDLENGDEETAFAAVIRPVNNNSTNNSSNNVNNNSNNNNVGITNSSNTNSGTDHISISPNVNNNNNNTNNNATDNSSNNNNNNTTTLNNISSNEKMPPNAGKYTITTQKRSKNITSNKIVRSTQPPSAMSGMQQNAQSAITTMKNSYSLIQQQQTQMAPQAQQPQQQISQNQYGHIPHGQSHGLVYTPPSQMHNPHHPNSVASSNKMGSGDGSYSSNAGNNNKAMTSRGNRSYQSNNSHPPPPPVSFSEPPPSITVQGIPNHQMGKGGMHPPHSHTALVSTHVPPPNVSVPDTQQPPPSSGPHHVVLQPVPQQVIVQQQSVQNTSNMPPPQPQRLPRLREDQISRSRDDEVQSLRKFHTDFNLAMPAGQQSSQQSQGSSQQDNNSNQDKDHNNHHIHHLQQQQQQQQNQQQTQQDKSHVQNQGTPPATSTVNNLNNNNNNNSNSSSNSGNSINNTNSSVETTPTSTNSVAGNNTENKPSSGPKKYVLNPAAKPFTPRNPSTPTQSRPHTPATPSPMAQQPQPQMAQQQTQVYATIPASAGGQHVPQMMMTYVMPNATTFQAPQQQHTMQRNQTRKMLHVAAATGQPLLTPSIQPVIHYPAQTPPTHPFQTPSYQQAHVVRMFHEPTHQANTYLAPTPPSTTPSPGQNHQYHPGPQPSPAGGAPSYPPQAPFQMLCPIIQSSPAQSFPLVYQNQQGHPQPIMIMPNPHQNSAQ